MNIYKSAVKRAENGKSSIEQLKKLQSFVPFSNHIAERRDRELLKILEGIEQYGEGYLETYKRQHGI